VRVLQLVQGLFAVCMLLFGLVALFGIGITGLFILVPAALLAVVAVATATRSKASVFTALAVDAALAVFAALRLKGLLTAGYVPGQDPILRLAPSAIDLAVPAVTLALVALAFAAVLLDWRNLRAARWF